MSQTCPGCGAHVLQNCSPGCDGGYGPTRLEQLEADNARLLAENAEIMADKKRYFAELVELRVVAEAVVQLRKANERWASSLAFGDDLSHEADEALAALKAALAAAGYLPEGAR